MVGEDWGIGILEEGREEILEWREKRIKRQARQKSFHGLTVYSFNLKTLHSFIHNFNYMVLMHMTLAGIAVYLAKRYDLSFDIQISLLVSPIVFPLAFSINADFQRRDTVLEYIAHFESSGMVLYLCMREWRKDTGLNNEWINGVHDKLKSILFLLREYLFTNEDNNRKFILRAIYEDFSDTNQMIEQMRTSKLQPNGPLVSRVIHLLSLMCLAFERLRVVKEYRSPRSIRSFNKVLIMLLPLIMAPYFVYLGKKSENDWSPYFIAIIMAFVFSALQGVQDKLDDPFDGMGEDDIKLNAIDDWTFNSFEATVQRFNVGRFNVSVERKASEPLGKMFLRRKSSFNVLSGVNSRKGSVAPVHDGLKREISRKHSQFISDPTYHPFHEVLENMKSNTCIKKNSSLRRRNSECSDNHNVTDTFDLLETVIEPSSPENTVNTDTESIKKEKRSCSEGNNIAPFPNKTIIPSPSLTLDDIFFQSAEVDQKRNLENMHKPTIRANMLRVDENAEDSNENKMITEMHSSLLNEHHDKYSTSLMKEKFHYEKHIDNDPNSFHEKCNYNNKMYDDNVDQSYSSDGSLYSNEKHVNDIKEQQKFKIMPIQEEPELYNEKVSSTYDHQQSLFNNNAPYENGTPTLNMEEKELPSNIPNIHSSSLCETKKLTGSSAITENHPNKLVSVNTSENNGNYSHAKVADLHENICMSTEIDMSQSEMVDTSSGSLVKDKFKILRRDSDLNQTKDVHSRLP